MRSFLLIFVVLFISVSCSNNKAPDSPASEASAGAIISKADLLDKIRGGLLGQILGNLNGLEHEMKYIEQPGEVSEYIPALPDGAWTDDDTDFEWVYIYLMQNENTTALSNERLKEVWVNSINKRIWCSNRFARHLMDIDIAPPYTGKLVFNPWAEFNISGQFVCETFGLTAPAMPITAAETGLNYTLVTIDSEPAQTTQLFTSMIAMAFVESDLEKLIDYGLQSIDPASKISSIVKDIIAWHQESPDNWKITRKKLKEKYTQDNNGIRDMNGYELNTGAVFGALLYGKGDFATTLRLAFNFGWDCDNVAATAGTILGAVNGYRWMMAQEWDIVDRYKNTTRDNMPMDETITSFADRIYDLAVKNILAQGGSLTDERGLPAFRVNTQSPSNIYPLLDLSEQVATYSGELAGFIKDGILNPVDKKQNAKATYLAICLDQWSEYAEEYPEQWSESKTNLAGYWKIMQNIFFQSSFYTKDLLKEKFVQAGFEMPAQEVPDIIVWTDEEVWKKPE